MKIFLVLGLLTWPAILIADATYKKEGNKVVKTEEIDESEVQAAIDKLGGEIGALDGLILHYQEKINELQAQKAKKQAELNSLTAAK